MSGRRTAGRWHPPPASTSSLQTAAILFAIAAIVALDWMTPAGIVVGFMLCIPILLTSMANDPRQVWLASGVSIVGYLLAAEFGRAPTVPGEFWIPNRLFTLAALPASCAIALALQWRRCEAERARDDALSACDLNQLLMSLLAHDLRAPLSLASQGLDYVDTTLRQGETPDRLLLADTRARLQRSLRAINLVLEVARAEISPAGPESRGEGRIVSGARGAIEAEVASFAAEAAAHGKTLVAHLDGLESRDAAVDGLVCARCWPS